jgi:pimeloyl-ACP methyl ester carboxylesterase
MRRIVIGLVPLVFSACHHDVTSDARVGSVPPVPVIAPAPAPSSQTVAPPLPSPPAPAGPATVERVRVPKDSSASIVRAAQGDGTRVVFLPGLCSNAYAYLLSFPEAARSHGGVIAIEGDKPCGAPDSGFRSFTWDATLQRSRIEAALAASGATAPSDGFTLVGYSAGASIAQMAHAKWPDLFPRLVLIAPPEDPNIARLTTARGVVSMSCSRDVPTRMKSAAKSLNAKGVPAIYLEMPNCTHGQVQDGERIFGEAFDWLDVSVRGT